jgi:hypothetical protein
VTTTIEPESKPSSRRAVLAGAIGGLGALAASAIGRPSQVLASDPNDVVLGSTNTSGSTTTIQNTTTSSTVLYAVGAVGARAVYGLSDGNTAVYGNATTGVGVSGASDSYIGVNGESTSYVGVYGFSFASDQPATVGWNGNGMTGVQGFSSSTKAALPVPKAKTGVYGSAYQDSSSKGVWGESPQGHGVHGSSNSGYAGYFAGKVYTTKWYEFTEIANPPAPIADRTRLFTRDNGSGKTELCVRFSTGAIKVLATQP